MEVVSEIAAGAAWLRERVSLAGKSRVIIGLSGGIDSAVVATWAVRALGPAAVTVVAMPYGILSGAHFPASSPTSLQHARLVASRCGVLDARELDIANTVDAEATTTGLLASLITEPDDAGLRLAFANLKARIRAVRLRYFANRLDGLVLGTENRTEHYLGYFTVGGDEESDLELLSRYLKREVVELARALDVPGQVISKAPSADLWPGQTDEDELAFTYEDADRIIALSDGSPVLSLEAIAASGVSEDVAQRVLARIRGTQFKRVEKPVFSRLRPRSRSLPDASP